MMSSVDGSRSVQGASDEAFINVCGPCNYGGTEKEAVNFCNDCQEYLCAVCTESHKGQKISRNHKIVSVKALPRHVTTTQAVSCVVLCGCSQNLGVVTYCEDHNDVICQSCKTIHHRKCKTVSVSGISTSYTKEKIDIIAKQLNKLKNETDRLLNEKKCDLQKLVSVKEKCETNIRTFRKELDTFLDLLQQNSLKELETWETVKRQEIESHLFTFSTTKQRLETDLKLLDDVKKTTKKADMFAADVKVSTRLGDYENLLEDTRKETVFPKITFKRNENLTDVQKKVNELGKLIVYKAQSKSYTTQSKSFLDMKIESSSQVDITFLEDTRTPSIYGCAFLPDGQVLLCDCANNKLKMLSKSFAVKDSVSLKSFLWDVSVINTNNAVITLPDEKQLQFIEVVPKLKTGRIIQLDKKCWGVEVVGEEIYVTCNKRGEREGEVRCLDMNGKLKRRIGVKQDRSFMFHVPDYLTVSSSSGKLFVSDYFTDTVTCLLSDGSVVYQYKDPDLRGTRGVCVDDEDNIIACGEGFNNVQVATAGGKRQSRLLTETDDIKKPLSVAFRHTDNTLIVGCRGQSELVVYKLT